RVPPSLDLPGHSAHTTSAGPSNLGQRECPQRVTYGALGLAERQGLAGSRWNGGSFLRVRVEASAHCIPSLPNANWSTVKCVFQVIVRAATTVLAVVVGVAVSASALG